MNVLCPLCFGKGTYPAKINDRKRGCYMGEAECPCCEGAKMVPPELHVAPHMEFTATVPNGYGTLWIARSSKRPRGRGWTQFHDNVWVKVGAERGPYCWAGIPTPRTSAATNEP